MSKERRCERCNTRPVKHMRVPGKPDNLYGETYLCCYCAWCEDPEGCGSEPYGECLRCSAVWPEGDKRCPNCGWTGDMEDL